MTKTKKPSAAFLSLLESPFKFDVSDDGTLFYEPPNEAVEEWQAHERLRKAAGDIAKSASRPVEHICGIATRYEANEAKLGPALNSAIRNLATLQALRGDPAVLAQHVATFRNQCTQILRALGKPRAKGRAVKDPWVAPRRIK